jgi:hypothetical protein
MTEPSAWLRGTVARRARELAGVVASCGPALVVAPLTRESRFGEVEDRTCDRCRVYVPPGAVFWLCAYPHGQLLFSLGLCADCARAERPEASA